MTWTIYKITMVPSFFHHPWFHAGFLSLSSSHTVAFLRAMEAGLAGPDGHQAEVAKTDASWQCIQNGWEWVAISSQVEESIPELPTWFQMGMNSSNSIGKPQTELELAATMASLFQQGLDSQQATKRAKEGDIKCQVSLPDVCHYCQKYGGGPEFPLIHFLARFAKQFGACPPGGPRIYGHLGQHGRQKAREHVPTDQNGTMGHHGNFQIGLLKIIKIEKTGLSLWNGTFSGNFT